jgi:hypothetical protein
MYQHHHELVRQRWLLNSYGCHHPAAADAYHTLSAAADKSESRLNVRLWSRSIVCHPLRRAFYLTELIRIVLQRRCNQQPENDDYKFLIY